MELRFFSRVVKTSVHRRPPSPPPNVCGQSFSLSISFFFSSNLRESGEVIVEFLKSAWYNYHHGQNQKALHMNMVPTTTTTTTTPFVGKKTEWCEYLHPPIHNQILHHDDSSGPPSIKPKPNANTHRDSLSFSPYLIASPTLLGGTVRVSHALYKTSIALPASSLASFTVGGVVAAACTATLHDRGEERRRPCLRSS